jgi:hypothetical protein
MPSTARQRDSSLALRTAAAFQTAVTVSFPFSSFAGLFARLEGTSSKGVNGLGKLAGERALLFSFESQEQLVRKYCPECACSFVVPIKNEHSAGGRI